MWVYIVPLEEVPVPPPIHITPYSRGGCELRVVIWNAENVILQEDNFLNGEKMSAIYVRG
jgi:hypothetical protein